MTASLHVSDISAAKVFYSALGCITSSHNSWVLFGKQAAILFEGPGPAPIDKSKPWDVLFWVPNARATLQSLRLNPHTTRVAADAAVAVDPSNLIRFFCLTDPDGNRVAFGSRVGHTVLSKSQVMLYWAWDKNGAGARDGAGPIGTLSCDVVSSIQSFIGFKDTALRFTGDGMVFLGSDCGLSHAAAFTISILVRFHDFRTDYPGLVCDTGNAISFTGLGPVYGGNQGYANFYLTHLPETHHLNTAVRLNPGRWYFVTIGYSDGLLFTCVNGQNRTEALMPSYRGPIAAVREMAIGCCVGGPSQAQRLRGDVAYVAIWGRALTDPAEMCSLHLKGSEEGLLALYRFDDEDAEGASDGGAGGGGTVLRDASRYHHDGDIRGAEWVHCPELRNVHEQLSQA